MAFVFRLQTVLDHRLHLADLAFNVFAQQQKRQQDCEVQIAWMQEELKRARLELAEREAKGIKAQDYILANEYVTVIRLQLMREQSRLPLLRLNTEKARLKLVEATRARKILETLKTRHREQWEREQLIAEQKLLDEVAVAGFLRRQTS
ncbi:MAG: flagellar export protein FliJ [Pseudomonadota bacterium]